MDSVQIVIGAAAIPGAPQRLTFDREAVGLSWCVALTSQGSCVDAISDGGPRVLMKMQAQ